MPKQSATHDKPLPQFTTRKGNAGFALAGVDGRSLMARRFREIYTGIESDLGGDLTEAQRHLIARAATMGLWLESREAELAEGAEFDSAAYCTVANAQRRLLADLGLGRVMRDAAPTVVQYLREKQNRLREAAQ
jgi:hypothetical protein